MMLFISLTFLLFFPIAAVIYVIVPRNLRHIYLLLLSYIFYMWWNPLYAILLTTAIIVTYVCGLGLAHAKATRTKKLIVTAGFLINMSFLVYFKYFNFLLNSLNDLLACLGVALYWKPFDILLPIGISFYMFQACGYLVDVYRRQTVAERNFLKYALFVAFFPQILAGPIGRSTALLPQIHNLPKLNVLKYNDVYVGLMTMLWGFFLKMVISDRIVLLVDQVFNAHWLYGFFGLSVAAVGFTIQIYCDFAGYSFIAVGTARVLGFHLMENFNTPYFSASLKEFWRRWHIALSSWFKDYLYIPLGGSRKSRARTYLNVFIVFLVSGVWHGANWTFVFWGALHGIYQIVGAMTASYRNKVNALLKVNTECFSYKFGQIAIVFFLVAMAWIFFRAPTLTDAFMYIGGMFSRWDLWCFFDGSIYKLGLVRQEFNILLVSLVILFLVDWVKYIRNLALDEFLARQNLWFRWAGIIILFMSIIIYGMYGPAFDTKNFIYSQF